MATRGDDYADEVRREREGRVAGVLGGLRAVGAFGADEAEAWGCGSAGGVWSGRHRLTGSVRRPTTCDADRDRRVARQGWRCGSSDDAARSIAAVSPTRDATGWSAGLRSRCAIAPGRLATGGRTLTRAPAAARVLAQYVQPRR
jgi:hypothetical protein